MEQGSRSNGIKSWPESERPRERLLSGGPNSLTDAELLAILLQTGMRGKSAVEFAREILNAFGNLQGVSKTTLTALLEFKGLGSAKVAQLSAALELGRRVAIPKNLNNRVFIKGTQAARDYFSARLRDLPEEHFRIAYLNRQGRLLEDVLIAAGSVEAVRPSIRVIVSKAIQVNASAMIAAHNHPSGIAEPSESDKLLTQDLIAATRPLSIKVQDHVIVGENTSFSFAESGLLDELEFDCLAPKP